MAKYKKKPVVIEAFQYDGDLKGKNGYYGQNGQLMHLRMEKCILMA